jgi:eukaryotic-like serine/threonine-protein kinase
MKIWNFISERPLLKNIIYMILVTFCIIWIVTYILKIYTQHGKILIVPDFSGITIDKLDEFSAEKKLKYVIIDSIFDFKKPKGTVISQEPIVGSKVKEYRTIYLTVVAKTPEQISVPNLIDLSLRQAVSILETYGLKLGRVEYTHSEYKNAILEQRYKGRGIHPDMTVKIGSAIDLVIGDGIKGSDQSNNKTDSTSVIN